MSICRRFRYPSRVTIGADRINQTLSKLGFHFSRTTSPPDIHKLRKILNPVDNGFDLIRAGSQADGGYLVPDDFRGLTRLISGGSDESWSFEKFFLDHYQLEITIVDRISKKPKDLDPAVNYVDAWIGDDAEDNFVSLSSIINERSKSSESDLVLQLDIEGAEFLEILKLSSDELGRFRIIVIEFHGLERALNREFFRTVISPTFKKLTDNFDVVHSHANNCCGAIHVHGVVIPRVLEITFHNKNRSTGPRLNREFPNVLDVRNDPEKQDLIWADKNV